MRPNTKLQLELSLLVIMTLSGVFVVKAQEVMCTGTVNAWKRDRSMKEYMDTHTCTCPVENRMPVCSESRSQSREEPDPPTVPSNAGTNGATTDNSGADAERKAKEAEFARQIEELRARLKPGSPLNSPNLGLKPATASDRGRTVQRIKELNCSAYWGVEALKGVRDLLPTLGAVEREDEYTKMRQYAEFSAQAKLGKSVQGCPPVELPAAPLPMASNPQIRFYDRVIDEAQKLLPQLVETTGKAIEKGKLWKETKDTKKMKEAELKKIVARPNTPTNRAKKKELVAENDELAGLLAGLQKDVEVLIENREKLVEKVDEIEMNFNDVSKNPDHAKDYLNK